MKGNNSLVLRVWPLLLLALLLSGGQRGPGLFVRGASAEEEGTTTEESSSSGSDQSESPPTRTTKEEVVTVVDTFNAKDHTDWGTYYDPKNIFCGKYGKYCKIIGWRTWVGGGDSPQ